MQIATFPVEVLTALSKQLHFTDLVILHACGDNLFNFKMKDIRVSLNVETPRCVTYYNLGLHKRYKFAHTLNWTLVTKHLNHIPDSIVFLFVDSVICCDIPASVKYCHVDEISNGKFLGEPDFLSIDHYKSWTNFAHLVTEYREFSTTLDISKEKCPKLTRIITDNENYRAVAMEKRPDCDVAIHCSHYRWERTVATAGPNYMCISCGTAIKMWIGNDADLDLLLPSERAEIIQSLPIPDDDMTMSPERIREVFSRVPYGVRIIEYKANEMGVNTLTEEILSLLPSTVAHLRINLNKSSVSVNLNGFKRRCGPQIEISASRSIPSVTIAEIGGFSMINSIIVKSEDRKAILAKHPRLGF